MEISRNINTNKNETVFENKKLQDDTLQGTEKLTHQYHSLLKAANLNLNVENFTDKEQLKETSKTKLTCTTCEKSFTSKNSLFLNFLLGF